VHTLNGRGFETTRYHCSVELLSPKSSARGLILQMRPVAPSKTMTFCFSMSEKLVTSVCLNASYVAGGTILLTLGVMQKGKARDHTATYTRVLLESSSGKFWYNG